MKSRGVLPDKLELWTTSNPNLETNVDYLKAKVGIIYVELQLESNWVRSTAGQ